ncbi:MAG: ABC transporter permease subunit [Nitriliruptorales bacterium]|nr:ABC transporter permease subunit [Nitriliruptorales bacterium]
MGFLLEVVAWFADPENWWGSAGIVNRTWEHFWYSAVASVSAIVIALPIGLYVGHTGRGGEIAVNVSNTGRSIPSFGIIILAWTLFGFGYLPAWLALAALALPPIVTNTYVGIRSVDPEVRDSAEGMGLTPVQVLLQVEMPVASPLIMAGIRTSVVQVVATATLAAFISLGGLGRLIIDGLAQRDFAKVTAGALLAAGLALLTEYTLAAVQRAVVPRGLQQRARHAVKEARAGQTAKPAEATI